MRFLFKYKRDDLSFAKDVQHAFGDGQFPSLFVVVIGMLDHVQHNNSIPIPAWLIFKSNLNCISQI